MYFVRQIEQLQRQKDITDRYFEGYIQNFLLGLKYKGMPLSNNEVQLNYVQSYYESFFKQKFDWRSFDPTTHWPIYHKTILNNISRESAYFRDKHSVEVIEESLKKYNKVFVVMGGSHLLVQEPVLKFIMRRQK
jgi:hypothetical protein